MLTTGEWYALVAGAALLGVCAVSPRTGSGSTGVRERLGNLRPPDGPLPDPLWSRLLTTATCLWRRGRRRGGGVSQPETDAVVDLVERLAVLARTGMSARRVWEVLAGHPGDGATEPGASPHDLLVPGRGMPPAGGPASLSESSRHLACGVLTVVDLGGDVASGLLLAGEGTSLPPERIRWLAAVWTVAERAGAPLADVLDGFADSLRTEVDLAASRAAAVAGPRASASVLTGLPVASLCLAYLVGADPAEVLVHSAPGRLVGLAGVSAWVVGRAWSTHLVRSAERRPDWTRPVTGGITG